MGDGVSMEKIRNLSLKKTMVLYTILSLIVTFFLSVSIIEIAGQIQEEVWWKYVDQDEYYQAMNDRNENFEVVVPRPNQSKMSLSIRRQRQMCIRDRAEWTGIFQKPVISFRRTEYCFFLLPDVELRSACFTKIN